MWIKIGKKFIEDDTKDKNTSYFGIFRPVQIFFFFLVLLFYFLYSSHRQEFLIQKI